MIIIRNVFQAEWGKAADLAHMMHQGMEGMPNAQGAHWRILTDLSGPFHTVVLEAEVPSLGEWEKQRQAMFADPAWQENMSGSAGLIVNGRAEYYNLEAQG